MLLKDDDEENAEPVREDDKEGVQPRVEMRSADDSEDDIRHRAHERDEQTGDGLESLAEDLDSERHGVDIRDVVGDNGECHEHGEEGSETVHGREASSDETSDSVLVVERLP